MDEARSHERGRGCDWCGAFYLGTVFSSASRETKSVAAAETTGSAPTQMDEARTAAKESAPIEAADAANCREQTWPYIARPCLANEKGERGVRVISTDKLADPVIGLVKAPPETLINSKAAPVAMQDPEQGAAATGVAQVAPLKSGAALGSLAFDPSVIAPPAPEPTVTAPPPPQPAAAPASQPQPTMQTAASLESQAVPDKRSEKSKRKTAKRQDERAKESEHFRVVTTRSDDDDDDGPVVIERQSGRIKGRVAEREYNVQSHDGGTRRVIVTSPDRDEVYRERAATAERVGGFPNIFGAIFGSN